MALRSADEYRGLLGDPNVQGALAAIRAAEGTANRADPYSVGFGYTTLPSLDSHPGRTLARPFTDKVGRSNVSTASGAYQFKETTWNEIADRLGLTDFSRESQDVAALAKLDQRGALDDALAGDTKGFTRALRQEWASMPGSRHRQPTVSQSTVDRAFRQAATVRDGVPTPAVERRPLGPLDSRVNRAGFSGGCLI